MRIKSGLHLWQCVRRPPQEEPAQRGLPPETWRGQYLCEVCEETMTEDVLAADESPSGRELAICARCRLLVRRP